MLIVAPTALPAIPSTAGTREWPASDGDSTLAPGREILGSSGNLRALIGTQASLERSFALQPLLLGVPIEAPGVHSLGLTAPDRESLVVVSLRSLAAIRDARLAAYRVGRWPTCGLAAGTRATPRPRASSR